MAVAELANLIQSTLSLLKLATLFLVHPAHPAHPFSSLCLCIAFHSCQGISHLSWGLLWRNFPHLHATCNPNLHTHTLTFFMWKFEYPAVISTIFSTLLPFWTVSVYCGAYFMHAHISLCLSLSLSVSTSFSRLTSPCLWVCVTVREWG